MNVFAGPICKGASCYLLGSIYLAPTILVLSGIGWLFLKRFKKIDSSKEMIMPLGVVFVGLFLLARSSNTLGFYSIAYNIGPQLALFGSILLIFIAKKYLTTRKYALYSAVFSSSYLILDQLLFGVTTLNSNLIVNTMYLIFPPLSIYLFIVSLWFSQELTKSTEKNQDIEN